MLKIENTEVLVMWFLLQKISDFLWFFAKFSICMILWYIIHG